MQNSKVYRLFFYMLGFFIIISLFAGCSEGPSDPEKLLPEKVLFFVSIKLNHIIKDKDLSHFILASNEENNDNNHNFYQIIPETANSYRGLNTNREDSIEGILNTIGINPNKVNNIIMFGGMTSISEKSEYEGVIIYGDYKAKQKVKELNQRGCIKNEYLKDIYYCDPHSDECIATLGRNSLLLGSKAAICKVIDVKKGKRKGLSNQPIFKALSNNFRESNAPIVAYLILPQNVTNVMDTSIDFASQFLGLTGLIEKVASGFSLHGLAIGISHSEDDFPVKMALFMSSEETASMVSGVSKFLISIFPSQEKPFKEFNTSHDGQILKIDAIVSRQEFLTW